ncbi:MAG: DUF882 domain-containing protein [Candidatus Aminicenantales bacterium]
MNEKNRTFFAREAPGRRRFLGLGAAALCLPFLTRVAAFASPRSFGEPLPPDRCLSFYNTHTGEAATVEYCRSGCLLPASLEKIDHILRDHRTGETRAIDVRLLDLLHALSRATATEEPYHIISGYRSPKTNDFLRARGGGVAANSLHLVGKAIDVRVPGLALRDLYRAAVKLGGGGVGLYPAADFVHLDVGRVRTW